MLKYLVAAIVLVPSAAFAGQASSQFSVGIRIVADSATQSGKTTRASARGFVRAAGSAPFRRYVVQEGNGGRIQTTEF